MDDTLALKYSMCEWNFTILVKSIKTDFLANLLFEAGKSDKNKHT